MRFDTILRCTSCQHACQEPERQAGTLLQTVGGSQGSGDIAITAHCLDSGAGGSPENHGFGDKQ